MGPKWFQENKESELQQIIQKLTTTGKKTLDEGEMKKLKNICKASDKNVNCAYYSLMTQLRKDHAEIRYSTLLIINELVMRSYVFRAKLEADFEEFLELVEETDLEKPLPPPLPVAKQLRIKGLEFIKNWATKFGQHHMRLQLALNYLQKCRKVDFDDIEARNSVERMRELREQQRLERIINEKIGKVKSEIQEIGEEISNVVTQMENCFQLLIPHTADNLFTASDFEHPENAISEDIEISNSCLDDKLRHHGFYDMKKTITIEIEKKSEIAVTSNEDTSPIIDNLKDLEKQICGRYYPMVTRWLKILTKGSNCSDLLKQAIDLKSLMEASLEKYKELKVKPTQSSRDSDEDDDDFEEVKEKEGYEETVKSSPKISPEIQPSCSRDMSYTERAYQWKMKLHNDDLKDPTTALSTLSKRFKNCQSTSVTNDKEIVSSDKEEQKKNKKTELLEKAPVLPYDIDLYHWEEEKPLIPEVVRFDSLHKFWETKDEDCEENETLKEVQIASLRTRKIDFSGKFEPVKWSCRAPLSNGKLCPRKDRYKCPFHGKIIPRDSVGNPSGDPGSIPGSSKESSDSVPDWQDPELLKDIEAATGIDLKIPAKRTKSGKKKKDGLTNIKKINNTVRERLTKKIVKRYRHYAPKLDEMERKRFHDKYGDQWNYY